MSDAYDRIATIYDADMGASMTLDDVGWYRTVALSAGGPVLEIGCGTGRVLSALLAAGVEAIGLDRSAPMLAQARRRCGPQARLITADLRELASVRLPAPCALALLPYSLVTYLPEEADWSALAHGLDTLLRPDARVVVDAFIPQPRLADGRWVRDYARRIDSHWLVRHKRITPQADGCHRIERRYRLREHFGGRTLVTRERIRPYHPEQLIARVQAYLGPVLGVVYDYGTAAVATEARFCSVIACWRPRQRPVCPESDSAGF